MTLLVLYILAIGVGLCLAHTPHRRKNSFVSKMYDCHVAGMSPDVTAAIVPRRVVCRVFPVTVRLWAARMSFHLSGSSLPKVKMIVVPKVACASLGDSLGLMTQARRSLFHDCPFIVGG